jgi:Family of unknown function (DUF6304)
MKQARWRGFYSDAHGREEITVDALGNQVTTVLRGVTFTGNGLNDLAPVTALARDAPFTLYYEALCACTIEWTMPVSLDTPDGVRQADLICTLTLGDPPDRPGLYYESLCLQLAYDGMCARTTGSHDLFETALADLSAELLPGVTLRACVTCGLSAYPPFRGSDFLGGLACFRDNEDAFLAISGKAELNQIWGTRTEFVLETYLCPRYRPALPAGGR